MAYAYNVDYWTRKSQVKLAPEMLQLRYANYPKDYFMGMLPSSQYGSVAALPSTLDISRAPNTLLLSNSSSKSFSYLNNPADDDYLFKWFNSKDGKAASVSWPFFKVNPNTLDSIFAVAADSIWESDQLLINCDISCKAVRPLSQDGMPY